MQPGAKLLRSICQIVAAINPWQAIIQWFETQYRCYGVVHRSQLTTKVSIFFALAPAMLEEVIRIAVEAEWPSRVGDQTSFVTSHSLFDREGINQPTR